MGKGFPLPNSGYYFSSMYHKSKWNIKIYDAKKLIVNVSASDERLCLKRAWDALESYCTGKPTHE